jgi:segregation and condensation protein B
MYRDIAEIIGIEDYDVVNPYNNKLKEHYDLLIISKGYKERVEKLNPYPIFEIKSATFDDLIESMNELKKLNVGAPDKIENYIETINKKKNYIKSLKYNKNVKINSKTEFIKKIIVDLGITPSDDGILIIPDYMIDEDDDNNYNKIILNTHRYDLNTLERIEDRYLSIIESINKL